MNVQSGFIVSITGLCCDYGNGRGIFDCDLQAGSLAGAGEVLAVLGPNGAGKTTLLKLILDQQVRTAGEISVSVSAKERGYLPNADYLFESLSGRENLAYLSHLKAGDSRAWEFLIGSDWDLLNRLDLVDRMDIPVNRLSSGENRKIQLIASLVGPAVGVLPRLVIWDEPHNNLDIVSNLHLGDVIKKLKAAGSLVIITSHILQALEGLLDRAVFLRHGRVVDSFSSPFEDDLTSLFLRNCLDYRAI